MLNIYVFILLFVDGFYIGMYIKSSSPCSSTSLIYSYLDVSCLFFLFSPLTAWLWWDFKSTISTSKAAFPPAISSLLVIKYCFSFCRLSICAFKASLSLFAAFKFSPSSYTWFFKLVT